MDIKHLKKFLCNLPNDYMRRSTFTYEYVNKEMEFIHNNLLNNNVVNAIEIGTYKGVSACFFSTAITGNIHTINYSAGSEYQDNEIEKAKILWESLNLTNIIQHDGDSLNILPKVISLLDKVQFIYVDGCHRSPVPIKEYEIIINSDIIDESNCLIYFDDGGTSGVDEVIDTYNLDTFRVNSGSVRAYKTFGTFNLSKYKE